MTCSSSSNMPLSTTMPTYMSFVDQELSNGVFNSTVRPSQQKLGSWLTKLTVLSTECIRFWAQIISFCSWLVVAILHGSTERVTDTWSSRNRLTSLAGQSMICSSSSGWFLWMPIPLAMSFVDQELSNDLSTSIVRPLQQNLGRRQTKLTVWIPSRCSVPFEKWDTSQLSSFFIVWFVRPNTSIHRISLRQRAHRKYHRHTENESFACSPGISQIYTKRHAGPIPGFGLVVTD